MINTLVLYLSFQWGFAAFIWKQIDSPLSDALKVLKNKTQ